MKIAKGLIASIIIITISGLAFTAGFLRERVVTKIEDSKNVIAEEEIDVERIEAKISDILLLDFLKVIEARKLKEEATADAIALNWTRFDLTINEINVYHSKIENNINRYEQLMRGTYLGALIQQFDRDSNESDFYFATEESDGFDFSISSVEFFDQDVSVSLYDIQPRNNFLNTFPPSVDYYNGNLSLVWASFTVNIVEENWAELYRDVLYQKQLTISSYLEVLADFESTVSYYGYGVTLITIATILASAMAASLNDKEREKEFSQIKAKIYEDESMIIKGMNRLAMPVLLIALTLSILGLLVPILIGLIT